MNTQKVTENDRIMTDTWAVSPQMGHFDTDIMPFPHGESKQIEEIARQNRHLDNRTLIIRTSSLDNAVAANTTRNPIGNKEKSFGLCPKTAIRTQNRINFEGFDSKLALDLPDFRRLDMFAQAETLKTAMEERHLSQTDLAKALSLSQSAVANKVRLLRYTKREQTYILENRLSERHARAILRIVLPKEREKILFSVAERRLTVAETEELVERTLNHAVQPSCNNENEVKKGIRGEMDAAPPLFRTQNAVKTRFELLAPPRSIWLLPAPGCAAPQRLRELSALPLPRDSHIADHSSDKPTSEPTSIASSAFLTNIQVKLRRNAMDNCGVKLILGHLALMQVAPRLSVAHSSPLRGQIKAQVTFLPANRSCLAVLSFQSTYLWAARASFVTQKGEK